MQGRLFISSPVLQLGMYSSLYPTSLLGTFESMYNDSRTPAPGTEPRPWESVEQISASDEYFLSARSPGFIFVQCPSTLSSASCGVFEGKRTSFIRPVIHTSFPSFPPGGSTE